MPGNRLLEPRQLCLDRRVRPGFVTAWSFNAASRLRTRMRAAPRLETSSIFSTVYTLPAAFQNLLHLVGRERIKAAAEAVQLNEVEVAALGGHLGGGVEARVVHPLVNQANGTLERAQVRDGVFREHGQAEARRVSSGIA